MIKIVERLYRRLIHFTAGFLTHLNTPSTQGCLDKAYQSWIIENEPASPTFALQRKAADTLAYRPLISILVPLHNPDETLLAEMLHSLLVQTYTNWQLCLAGCIQPFGEFGSWFWHTVGTDPRIRIKQLDENLGISGNTNSAAAIAEGEYLAFVDQDDTLSPDALYEVVKALNSDRIIDVLYSDHDILSRDGTRRFSPLFKPDWSPEILLSANYVTHLSVIRTSLFQQLGRLDPAMDGAQDLDLMLRLSEGKPNVCHIPQVLYHWRESPGSTATDFANKPYTMEAQLRAIKAHLERLGLTEVGIDQCETGYIHVKWKVEPPPSVSIIIPCRGANPRLKTCVRTILEMTDYPNYELVIINNGEKRPEKFGFFKRIQKDPRVKVLHFDKPFNYSAVNNYGVKQSIGEMLLFLNDDTEVIYADWLSELVMWASRKEVGAVGAQLLYYDRTVQHAGVIVGLSGFAGHPFQHMPTNAWTAFGLPMWYRDYLAVTGACLMTRREVLHQVGGWPEDLVLCGNDVVLGLRINEAGYRVVYNPFVRLYHHESATHQGNIPAEDFRTSYLYYREILQQGDPYYSPNLSLWSMIPVPRHKSEIGALQFVREFLERLELS